MGLRQGTAWTMAGLSHGVDTHKHSQTIYLSLSHSYFMPSIHPHTLVSLEEVEKDLWDTLEDMLLCVLVGPGYWVHGLREGRQVCNPFTHSTAVPTCFIIMTLPNTAAIWAPSYQTELMNVASDCLISTEVVTYTYCIYTHILSYNLCS